MTKLPSLPLFIDDYEAATAHLSLEEDGAYSRLLRLCWRTPGCSIPDDDTWITRHMRCDTATLERVVKPILREFFTRSRSRWFQKRLRQEHAYVSALSSARRAAGRKGGNAKAQKTKATGSGKATDLLEQTGGSALAPTPTLTPTPKGSVETSVSTGAEAPESAEPADVIPTTKELVWKHGKGLLAAAGKNREQAGRILGKWVGAHGEAAVLEALDRCKREGAIDPVAFVEGALRWKAKKSSGTPQVGDEKTTPEGKLLRYGGVLDGWLEVRE